MSKLQYTNAREEDNLILNLWNLFTPGQELGTEAKDIAKKLQTNFGFIIGDVPIICGIEPDDRFRKLYGDMNERQPVLPIQAAK